MSGIGTVIIQSGGAQVSSTGGIAATVSDAPRGFANQPTGTTLHGTVEGRAQGQLLVRTELGLLRLNTSANPPAGSRVSVQIQNVGPQTTVHLYGTHGHGLGSALQATGGGVPSAASPAAVPTLPPGVPVTLAPGTTLAATLLPAVTPSLASALAQAGGNAAAGSLLGSTAAGGGGPSPAGALLSGQAGTAAPGGSTTAGAANAGNVAGTGIGGTPGAAGQAGAAALQTGQTLGPARGITVQIVSVHPPGASAAAAAASAAQSSSAAVVLSGIATGTNAAGQTTLHTALGTVILDAKADVPRGTQFNLEVSVPRGAGGGAYGPPQAILALGRAYPELGQLVSLLSQIDPTAAQTLMNSLPQAGPQMSTGLLFFMTALRMGDFRSFLGADGRAAVDKAGRGDLLRSIGDTVNRLGRAAGDQPAGEWRALPVPVANGGTVEQIMVFVRDHGDKEGEGDGTAQGTRFVVEFNLSRFGQMQIDGLVHTRDKRFDLIVRSRDALSNGVRYRISELFETANEISGFKGGVSFQAVHRFPVSPLEEMARSARGAEV